MTEDDCMSKVGTKHAAMVSDPVRFLTNFGEEDTLSEQDKTLAEKYLVRVWAGVRSATKANTFDELRFEAYTSASVGIDSFPPTSSIINGHIHRGAFLVYKACHLLATDNENVPRLEPSEHGWENHCGALLPSKCLRPLPPHTIRVCKCTSKCDSRRFGCRCSGVLCITFCHGKSKDTRCNNQNNE